MSKKPSFVEIYAWNEPILGSVAVGWGLFLALYAFEPGIIDGQTIFGGVVSSGGLVMLLLQAERIRTFIDFRMPATIIKVTPKAMQLFILRMWPASTLIRLWMHFLFTVWWVLMGVTVSLNVQILADVRLVFYFGFALLHFDRLMRLIQWMRK